MVVDIKGVKHITSRKHFLLSPSPSRLSTPSPPPTPAFARDRPPCTFFTALLAFRPAFLISPLDFAIHIYQHCLDSDASSPLPSRPFHACENVATLVCGPPYIFVSSTAARDSEGDAGFLFVKDDTRDDAEEEGRRVFEGNRFQRTTALNYKMLPSCAPGIQSPVVAFSVPDPSPPRRPRLRTELTAVFGVRLRVKKAPRTLIGARLSNFQISLNTSTSTRRPRHLSARPRRRLLLTVGKAARRLNLDAAQSSVFGVRKQGVLKSVR
ncbi:hypothetical protein R3P38DRAFT_3288162 [Favolaschia claudopus]|uniref:Uncharacterized protein n=1 Tax=Favolaschia claudopus TaxID=2862362 RepID=A0AAV9ZYL4_9AGAR